MLIALQAKPAQLLFNASAIQSLLQGTVFGQTSPTDKVVASAERALYAGSCLALQAPRATGARGDQRHKRVFDGSTRRNGWDGFCICQTVTRLEG